MTDGRTDGRTDRITTPKTALTSIARAVKSRRYYRPDLHYFVWNISISIFSFLNCPIDPPYPSCSDVCACRSRAPLHCDCQDSRRTWSLRCASAAVLVQRPISAYILCLVARWCNGKAFGLAISRSRVQILLEAMLRNNLRQVVHTYVCLLYTSPSPRD